MSEAKTRRSRAEKVSSILFIVSCLLIVYMPLHVFISQSASLVTGGLDVWKAAKDVFIVLLVPFMLYLSYRRGLFRNPRDVALVDSSEVVGEKRKKTYKKYDELSIADKTTEISQEGRQRGLLRNSAGRPDAGALNAFRWLMILGGLYAALHMLFVVLDKNDDTYSAIVGSVYNTRVLGYLLLGYLVGSAPDGKKYLRYLLTFAVIIASAVALFGVLQYFLPTDLLTHVGYSIERGVKPLFFIDDRPDLPRVMSTLKDPNSLGAYLILPILLTGYALVKTGMNEKIFIKPFKREVLIGMLATMLLALTLTFSRGALLGLILSIITLLSIVTGQRVTGFIKKYYIYFLALIFLVSFFLFQIRNNAIIQDYVFHAAISTDQEDPNEKRVTLVQDAIDDVVETPQGSGPGSAGLVSITNPKGGVLTENYYLQIAYEVGWLGIILFVAILSIIIHQLAKICRKNPTSAVLLSALVAYLFYSLLIHLWSNEALALQWWLLAGVVLGSVFKPEKQQILKSS